MNESETEKRLSEMEDLIRESKLQAGTAQLDSQQQDQNIMLEDREKGMISEQLDLGEILDRMYNLLRGYSLQKDDEGVLKWTKPVNNDLVVLSDYGINYVMWMLQSYLTKNTLLSNYSEKQIDQKMEDFSTTIADAIFMEYDKMFLYPTLADCKGELSQRIKQKVEVRKFALELMGKKASPVEIEKSILAEIEDRLLEEMEIIKQQKIKNKLKRFESMCRMIQDTVHSAYQRAWKGQERTTLRTHMHISETNGGIVQPVPQQSMNPMNMFRRK